MRRFRQAAQEQGLRDRTPNTRMGYVRKKREREARSAPNLPGRLKPFLASAIRPTLEMSVLNVRAVESGGCSAPPGKVLADAGELFAY